MVVPCVAELSDPVNDAMVPRRCSARIKKLKSEQEAQRERESQRVRCRSNDDSVLGKKTKVYKKSKLVTPSQAQAQAQAPNNDVTVATVDNDDVTITNVAAPNDCTDHPVPETYLNPQLSGNGTEKSSHARVTETLRIFNKHYLHFVQEEEIRCGRAQADQKTKKHSKSKEAEDDGKRSSKRPDLKAISKMISEKEVLNRERIGSLPGIDVGHQFFSRAEMVVAGFHNHWLNGIDCVGQSAGKKGEYKGYSLPLAVSIVVSGQYEDDQDNYEEVVYTGQGGNDLLGNKRQIKDQVMERGNLGLKNCMEQSVPVRVTRGHRCVNSYVGKVYTYDGLYKVVNYWAEKGISGFTVYKFRLKRIKGQPVLTTNQVHFTRGCIPNSISEIRGLVCEDISGGLEDIPIPATNLVDDPPAAPSGFTYSRDIVCAKGIKFPSAPTGCNCHGSCLDPRVCSCAKLNGSEFPYVHKDGGRLVEPKAVVFECGPNCGCGPACVNRTSQKGLRYRLEVFRTPNKGWGVRSWDYIPSGATICEYTGLLKKTDQIDPAADNNYVFDIDCLQTMKGLDGRERRLREVSLPGYWHNDAEKMSDGGPEYCIDAVSVGNVARFINHSCQPNLFVQCVLSTHHDIGLARVVLMAADNIPPLQELTYDYGYVLDSVMDREGKVKQMACYCGAADCRKRLF
ncbi:histone-lysine N-methyltransferase, H3 lysine-9 specific SUVH4 isoform X1 [Solanum pennellii]|uniref:Histone-lysine N-methyltransferase, H3 lysine-9 specific SUVH4 isoform X1 n=2 Tax=Solanum pennellii TaxID=28526 RepID=A0ABM1FYI1_SOLPN|nr:histone-lysine N-methyltransferase, H3 lysine-9 specific SUVH4 isoform X1 [Solanum pennellii]